MKFDILKRLDANAIEDGAWLHLTDPVDGEPLYRDPDKKLFPCKALVRSDQSKRVVASDRSANQITTARLQRAKPNERDVLARNLTEEAVRRRFGVILVALENCTAGESGVQQVSDEDAGTIYDDMSMRWMVNQVFNFSRNEGSYGIDPTVAGAPDAGKKTTASKN